jgi:L-threonylcarbamoyladenylate synthase
MDERVVEQAVTALRAGQPVVVPMDTVYGLCAYPYCPEPAERLYKLKGRTETQPTALVAIDLQMLFECVPELRGRANEARALLPGPFTLIFPNPARRYRWLTGDRPETIGVRVPELSGPGRAVLNALGAVAATSANLPGKPDPRRLDEVPDEIREACGALVDGGELPGRPSTVIDLTGAEPSVVREGAVPAQESLDRLAAVNQGGTPGSPMSPLL